MKKRIKTWFLKVMTAAVLVIAVGVTFRGEAAPLSTRVEMVVNFDGQDSAILFELDEVNAPRTCENFRKLCKNGFYNGTLFHRVIPGYIVQAGDPLSKEPGKRGLWGTGGPGYTLAPEFGRPHLRGAIAMARLGDAVNPGKESSGSQFYVALDRIESLDGEYTVFGQVISGMEVLDRIGEASADQNNSPVSEIRITKTTVIGESSAPPVPEVAPPAAASEMKVTSAPAPPVTNQGPAPESRKEEQVVTDITPSQAPAGTQGSMSDSGMMNSTPQKDGQSAKVPKKEGPFTKFLKRIW